MKERELWGKYVERNFWLYRARDDEERWKNIYNNGLIGIPWRELGDLKQYSSKEEIEKVLNEKYPSKSKNRQNDRLANWQFCNDIKIGDVVIATEDNNEIVCYGKVIKEYFYDDTIDDEFASFIKIEWIKRGKWKLEGWTPKTLTRMNDYQPYLDNILRKIGFYDNKVELKTDFAYRDCIPHNQILYGPPGTGKTFSVADKAIEILDPSKLGDSREMIKKIFDTYKNQGQIEFITFHQSYSYEDFIEGIRPKISDRGEVSYEIKDGIFKKICKKALENYNNSLKNLEELQEEEEITKKVEDFLDHLIENEIKIQKTKKGEFFVSDYDKHRIYISTKDTKIDIAPSMDEFIRIIKSKKDFASSKEMAKEVFGEDNQQQKRTYLFHLFKLFKNFKDEKKYEIKNIENHLKPYVLIIDEINRGNVSKIFGELITLIEEDKRIGNDEELRVTLPYSQEEFGIPKNLYIIGTMNTADRSITSLDIALRRRFDFIEVMPDSSKLEKEVVDGINLKDLLDSMNERIRYLYDREKMIGHAFFLKVENKEDLKRIFQKKIVPLLQEYFYNDYERIDVILNHNGMIIEKKIGISSKIELDLPQKAYCVTMDDKVWDDEETYKKIYQE
ncbi:MULTISPECIES: McrB family protein [unclassified Helicobacter]|uniref:McrB family protein n=1 Tax=unclassified Helicobacter TaxID=2593540 RepID=UPI001F41D23C|nr:MULTISPECIES: AAA family ATPase [unclassified Helicobacter]